MSAIVRCPPIMRLVSPVVEEKQITVATDNFEGQTSRTILIPKNDLPWSAAAKSLLDLEGVQVKVLFILWLNVLSCDQMRDDNGIALRIFRPKQSRLRATTKTKGKR